MFIKKTKRISFSAYDALLIYEWRLAVNQIFEKENKQGECCGHCRMIEKRLEEFIDEKKVALLKKQIKKHPYIK